MKQRLQYAREHARYEWVCLKEYWHIMLIGGIFQYVHSVATNVAYYMHVPREPLNDIGFAMLPAFTPQQQVISEIIFFLMFGSTILFVVVYPWFDLSRRHLGAAKRLYSTMMLARFLAVCALAQALRIVTFLVTSLPGPNYHCRPDSKNYNPPRGMWDIFTTQDPFTHCGDLIFSSHTIFVILCVATWTKYANLSWVHRWLMYLFPPFFGLFVVAARKHYSVDIVVAMYVVPLVWTVYDTKFPDKLPPELLANEPFAAEEIQTLAGHGDVPPSELPREARGVDDNDDELIDIEMGRA